MSTIECELRRKACSAAWTPDFLADYARLSEMSAKDRENYEWVEFQLRLSTLFLVRAYLIGDPTEEVHPPSKHRAVLVSELGTFVITSDSFFARLFACMQNDGLEPTREDLFSICQLYLRLFEGDLPLIARPEIIYGPGTIPPSADYPIEEACSKQITPPSMAYQVPDWVRVEDLEFQFSCEMTTWDPSFGAVVRWTFKIKCFPYNSSRSEVEFKRQDLARYVGRFIGPK
jgi:hypothetical protein